MTSHQIVILADEERDSGGMLLPCMLFQECAAVRLAAIVLCPLVLRRCKQVERFDSQLMLGVEATELLKRCHRSLCIVRTQQRDSQVITHLRSEFALRVTRNRRF